MNVRSVSRRAIGALMLITMGCSKGEDNGLHPEALHPAKVSKIYVLTNDMGTRLTIYAPDGRDTGLHLGLSNQSQGVAVDDDGNIYVACKAGPSGVLIFGPDFKAKPPILVPQLWGTINVALSQEKIFVLGTRTISNSEVRSFNFDHTATPLKIVTGISGSKGLTVDATGKIWVVGESNNVKTWDASGAPSSPAFSAGLNTPRSIAVAPDGKVYITNYLGVGTYLPNGKRIEPTLSTTTIALGPATPTAVAVDASGKVYVGYYSIDRDHGRVAVYTPDGKLIDQFPVPSGVEGIAVH